MDDITKFMKQKSAIEKTYAESLLKLSATYASKKIASKVGDTKESDTQDAQQGQQNIFQLWIKVLEENEKMANLRLAAAQVNNQQMKSSQSKTKVKSKVQVKLKV